MGAWDLLLTGLVLLFGLCGVLVPGVPGSWLVWAAVLWWALKDPQAVAWWVLVGATVLLFLSQVVRWALPPRRLRAAWSGVARGLRPYGGRRPCVRGLRRRPPGDGAVRGPAPGGYVPRAVRALAAAAGGEGDGCVTVRRVGRVERADGAAGLQ
ncbi:hypothetical protein SALBM217S_10301 [Streptomyces griseoloalbus]